MTALEELEATALDTTRGKTEAAIRTAVRIGYRAGLEEGITRLAMLAAMEKPRSFAALQHFCGVAEAELLKRVEESCAH